MALSKIRHATSPRLSTLGLDFSSSTTINDSAGTWIKNAGNDLRQIADEVTRIEREFEGALNFNMVWDSMFRVVFDTLDVSFCSRSG